MELEQLKTIGEACGFTLVAPVDPKTIVLHEDVREMCATGHCGKYGKSWSCPPGCGELDACRKQVGAYTEGILVQTIMQLEDEFDGEGMMEAEQRHKIAFEKMHEHLKELFPNLLALGAGACTRCKICTYPDMPCRFPTRMTASMEAYGMLVQEVCRANDVTYYYGKNTIAYSGCFLLK